MFTSDNKQNKETSYECSEKRKLIIVFKDFKRINTVDK